MTSSYNVSVVIPTFNRAHCILRAVNSVLNQTVAPFEVLVIDDGSTDETTTILQDVDSRVQYVRKDNGGVSSARNLGISLSKGNWIAFLDSDDTWHPDKLEQQLECIRHTGAKVCFTGTTSENGTRHDGIQELAPSLAEGEHGFFSKPVEFITRSNKHPFIQSLLIRKDVLNELNGFDETLQVAEDTALFYELVSRFDIALINASLVDLTRERTTSGLSDTRQTEKAAKHFDCYLQVQARALTCFSGRPPVTVQQLDSIRIIRQRMAYFYSRRAEIAHVLGEHELGRHLASEALQLAGDNGTFIRSIFLAYGYLLLKAKLARKWIGTPNKEPVAPTVS